jgi:hypothetical protein
VMAPYLESLVALVVGRIGGTINGLLVPALAQAFADQGKAAADHKALRRLEEIKESLRVNEDEYRVERLIDRDTYLKTKNKLETQRHEVDTKINAASGQRFLINVPRAREEWKAAYENGNPSRANDRRRRADLLLRPHLAMAAATNVKNVPRWPAPFSFGERSAAAARRR